MKVKICGITSGEDAAMCEDLGADALGFVCVPGRSRSRPLSEISDMCSSLGPITAKVLVCNPDSVDSALSMLARSGADVLQLYSLNPEELAELREQGARIMRVVRPSDTDCARFAANSDALVFEEGVPGTGSSYDYSIIPQELRDRAFIAGGLNPDNVHLAKAVKPYGVDVSSGVELILGKKDPGRVEAFIRRCRS